MADVVPCDADTLCEEDGPRNVETLPAGELERLVAPAEAVPELI